MNIVAESSKVILALADSIKTMTRITRIVLMTDALNRAVEELQNCLSSQPELFSNGKRWEIVDGTSQRKSINLKITPPFESKNPQVLRTKKTDGRAGESNKTPIVSSKSKIWPHGDIPETTDDSAVAGINLVKQNETIQGVAFMATLPLATIACLLIEIVARLQTLIMAVDELGKSANFTTSMEDTPIDDNHNASAETLPSNHSPTPLQPIENLAVVIPAAEQPLEFPAESAQVKDRTYHGEGPFQRCDGGNEGSLTLPS